MAKANNKNFNDQVLYIQSILNLSEKKGITIPPEITVVLKTVINDKIKIIYYLQESSDIVSSSHYNGWLIFLTENYYLINISVKYSFSSCISINHIIMYNWNTLSCPKQLLEKIEDESVKITNKVGSKNKIAFISTIINKYLNVFPIDMKVIDLGE